jgi:hypothetical protein
LIEQRHKVQHEIGGLQAQINEEIDRQLRSAEELPARILSEIAGASGGADLPMGTYGSIPSRLADTEKHEPMGTSSLKSLSLGNKDRDSKDREL